MKKQIFLLTLFSFLWQSYGCESVLKIDAADDKILVTGRHVALNSGAIQFAASGVALETVFKGSQIDAFIIDTLSPGSDHHWFRVIVDGNDLGRFRTQSDTFEYRLAENLTKDEHHLQLVHETEGINGRIEIKAFIAGEFLKSPERPEKTIAFYGDSITSGFGLTQEDSLCGEGNWYDHHSAWKSYGARVSRNFDAGWILNSISGIGITRSWSAESPDMLQTWNHTFMNSSDSTELWDFSGAKADLLVISLGTNDFSDGDGQMPRKSPDKIDFIESYIRLVENITSMYPGIPVLISDSPMLDGEKRDKLRNWLDEIKSRLNKKGIEAEIHQYSTTMIEGCSQHPGEENHSTMAKEMNSTIEKWLEW